MKFTQVRADTFESIQINAGILLNGFTPATGTYEKTAIIGATTGGNNFESNPETTDFGEDIDNVPNNTWQLKRLSSFNPVISGTFVAADTALGRQLVAAADIDKDDSSHIIPRDAFIESDFQDIWLVGDYSTKNGKNKGGFIAIHVKHALSTGGFSWQTEKNGKGQFGFEFTGHYDLENIEDPPFEIYIRKGEDETSAAA